MCTLLTLASDTQGGPRNVRKYPSSWKARLQRLRLGQQGHRAQGTGQFNFNLVKKRQHYVRIL